MDTYPQLIGKIIEEMGDKFSASQAEVVVAIDPAVELPVLEGVVE